MPGAHGAGAEGSAFLGHLLSALGQLGVGAPAGGKKKLIWNMEKKKQLVGIKIKLPHGIQKTQKNPSGVFFFPNQCENQPTSGYFCYSNPTTTLNFRTQLQHRVKFFDFEMR